MITATVERLASPCTRMPRMDQVSRYYQAVLEQLPKANRRGRPSLDSLGITSCHEGEGTSTVAAHLAAAAAAAGRRVLLIDANESRPSLHRAFGVDRGPGLRDVLGGDSSLSEAAHPSPSGNLHVLAAGDERRVGGDREPVEMKSFLKELHNEYDLVVVDLPPALEVAAAQTAAALDGVLLVIESERVRGEVGQRATSLLSRCGAHVLGAVLNKRRDHIPGWLYRTL